jgi:hypothetical protein
MHRQFLPLSLERIFRTSAFQAQCFLEKAAFAPSSFGVFHDLYPCVTALLLICSKLAPTSARPSHGMMSREESGRLGDHVWMTGKPEVGTARQVCFELDVTDSRKRV